MGGFVLFFVIHMAGAIMEQNETALAQKEEAETHLRLSEDRFRSLIQNSSDVTMILGDASEFRYVSPAIKDLLQYEPDELVGLDSTDFVHPEDLHIVQTLLGGRIPVRVRDGNPRVPHAAQGRDDPRRGSRRVEPDRPPLGGRVRRQHP